MSFEYNSLSLVNNFSEVVTTQNSQCELYQAPSLLFYSAIKPRQWSLHENEGISV